MTDTAKFSVQQAKGALKAYRDYLAQWSAWLDAQAEAISGETAPKETMNRFSILKQHIGMLRPWIQNMHQDCPVPVPPETSVQHLAPVTPNFVSWPKTNRLEPIKLGSLQAGKLGSGAEGENHAQKRG